VTGSVAGASSGRAAAAVSGRAAGAVSVQAVAAPALARLPAEWRHSVGGPDRIDCDGFVVSVTPPGTPWLPNAIALGPGPMVVWNPVVEPVEPGPALAARGTAILAALGVAGPAGVADALSGSATSPSRAAVAALIAALRTGDPAARRRAALAVLGRGAGLTPEGDDLLAGACVTAAAAGDPLALAPGFGTLTTPLSATLLELAAAGAGPRPVHALLDLADECWRTALRELEGLGASSGRAIALGVGAAAAVLGARSARSVPPRAARHFTV
jgi:hypothetical protein